MQIQALCMWIVERVFLEDVFSAPIQFSLLQWIENLSKME